MRRSEGSVPTKAEADDAGQDFETLLYYITNLANHKLGYPVSLLTYLGVVNNSKLGIEANSLSNILLNNVGDPFKDSLTSLMEVKGHERKLISILERYYGMAKNEARGYVTTGGTEGNFASLWWSKRYLINLVLPELIKNDDQIKVLTSEEQSLITGLSKIPTNDYKVRMNHLQKIMDQRNAIADNKNIVQQLLTPTVFFCKGHTHYSIPKIAEILRLNTRPVSPNPDGSIDLAVFKKELMLHLAAHPHSSVLVVANIGTTITGAIDNVPEIKKILDSAAKKPTYTIHMDGALTGFVLPILKPFGEMPNYFEALGVNTLAVSAHKYPGLSQPCGILLARRPFFEKAFEKSERSVDYVGDILDVTITGSRSGLNVLMFYNALCAMGLDKDNTKLTAMVKENLDNAKYLKAELIKVYGEDKVLYLHHFNMSFPQPSMGLAQKYQLMLTGGRANICVLTNVTRPLIDQFIIDLKHDKENIMENISKNSTIETMTQAHLAEVQKLFIKTFCEIEPITKHLNMGSKEYEPFVKEVLDKAVKDGLSPVMLSPEGKVIGFIIVEDLASPFTPNLANYPKMKPIIQLIDTLSSPFTANRKFQKNKIAHFWIAGIEPGLMGHGLFSRLSYETTLRLVKDQGFEYAYSEFTNELSEKATKHYDRITLVNRLSYNDYTLDGSQPFKGLKGAASAYICAIKPGQTLENVNTCYTKEAVTH